MARSRVGKKFLKISKINLYFDERTIPSKRPINFKCQYRFSTSVVISYLSIIFFQLSIVFSTKYNFLT